MSSPAGGNGALPASGIMSGGTTALSTLDGSQLSPTAEATIQPVNVPPGARPRGSAESETHRWFRRAVAVAFPIHAVNSIFTAFADNMPASHHLAALIAAPVFVIVWAIEVSGVSWPRLALKTEV